MKRQARNLSPSESDIRSNKKKKSSTTSSNNVLLYDELLAQAVPLNQSDTDILLNDKHAPKYSIGSFFWLDAKRHERVEVEQRNIGRRGLPSRVGRVVDIFRQKLNLPEEYQPRFWYKLDDSEINGELRSKKLGKMEGYSGLYIASDLKDEKVRSNVKNFRLSKTPTRSAKKRLDFPEISNTPSHHHSSEGKAKQHLYATPAHPTTRILHEGLPTTTPLSISSEASYSHGAPVVTPGDISTEDSDIIRSVGNYPVTTGENDLDNNNTHNDHAYYATTRSNESTWLDAFHYSVDKSWNPNIKLEMTSGKLLESLMKHSSLSSTDAMNVVMSSFPDAFPTEEGNDSFQVSPIRRRRQITHPPVLGVTNNEQVDDNCDAKPRGNPTSEDAILPLTNGANPGTENYLFDNPDEFVDFIKDVNPFKI